MSANPSFQPEDCLAHLRQPVVIPPAAKVTAPAITQLVAGEALPPVPQFPHFLFESRQALRRYSDPSFAIQSKAQELAFPDPPRPALFGIHLQSQMSFDPSRDRLQRPLRRRLTAYVERAVIGIPAKRVPSLLQLAIQCIQINVGQQR